MAVTNYYSVDGTIIGERTAGSPRIDYLTDALGSVTATVDQTGTVQNTYRYKPYGAQLFATGATANLKFSWVGNQGYRQSSGASSDIYVRSRHYGTLQGRWSSRDSAWPLSMLTAMLTARQLPALTQLATRVKYKGKCRAVRHAARLCVAAVRRAAA